MYNKFLFYKKNIPFEIFLYIYFLSFIIPFIFVGEDTWWEVTIYCHVILSFFWILLANNKIIVVYILVGIFLLEVPWLFNKISYSSNCQQISQATGYLISKNDNNSVLLKAEVWCENKKYSFAQIPYFFSKDKEFFIKRIPEGSKVELYHLSGNKNKKGNLTLHSTSYTRTYNATYTKNFFNKSRLWFLLKLRSDYYLQGHAKELFQSILLANRVSLSKPLKLSVQKLGIYHLFAISGVHVIIIFFFFRYLFRSIGFICYVFNISRNQWIVIDSCSLLCVFLYIDFIGYPITALRSFYMLSLWYVLKYCFLWIPEHYFLLTIAVIMLTFSPQLLVNIGFQLSFFAVLSIIVTNWYTPTSLKKLQEKKFYKTAGKTVLQLFYMNIGITIFLLPFQFFYFQYVTPLNFLWNCFYILFFGWVFLPLGFLILLISGINLYFFTESYFDRYIFGAMQLLGDLWGKVITEQSIYSGSIYFDTIPYTFVTLSILLNVAIITYSFIFYNKRRMKNDENNSDVY